MRTFTVGRKKYAQYVPCITDASSLIAQGDCKLFPYTRRRLYGSLGVFIRTADGAVYCATRGVNIIDDYGCNDVVRRMWCRAAGVSWKDFRVAFRAARAVHKKEETSAKLYSLRAKAGTMGYKLVRNTQA